EKASAEILLTGRALQIAMSQGELSGVGLEGVWAEVALPSSGPYWLNIRSEALLDATQGVNFIHATPLAAEFDPYFDLFTLDAPLTLTLDLSIPLGGKKNEQTKVNGLVQVSEGSAFVKEWGLQFSHLNGVMGFTEKGAYTRGLSAQLFNKPVELTVGPVQENKQTLTAWQLKGILSIPEIAKQIPSHLWEYASGQSAFTARLLTGGNGPGADFSIASNLEGIALNLPAPLNKTAQRQTPFRYTRTLGGTHNQKMRFEFNHIIDALLQFNEVKTEQDNTEQVLTGGRIQLGGALAKLEVPKGVYVTGALDQFSLDIWRDFIASFEAKNKAKTTTTPGLGNQLWSQLQQVDVKIAKLEAFHYPLTRASVRLNRASEGWLLKLVSHEWEGQARFPQQEKAPVVLNFDYCNWDASRYTKGTGTIDPRDIPAITFACQEFIYNQKSLGLVRLEMVPQELGLRLSR
ncbi:MAG TPA: DUF3971 domain-containing protein, partial [Gammaproteobacteria bacterium]|nr:DUF3971 domain-containing protein [Gammaproteobacteria bacterium]